MAMGPTGSDASIRGATMRRCAVAKVAITVVCALGLMSLRLRGRQQARLQARIADIALVRDQLQASLDRQKPGSEQLVAILTNGTNSNSFSLPAGKPAEV